MTRDVLRYRLGPRAARRRAFAGAVVGAVSSLAPLAFAAVLLGKLGWTAPATLRVAAGCLVVLVLVRAIVAYRASRRRLEKLVIEVFDEAIRASSARDAYLVEAARVARITEIEGPLGGLRIESAAEPATGAATFVHVPCGGEGFGEVRALVERWRPIERRARRGRAARVGMGVVVVAAIFFVPFLLDDFVARSKIVAAVLVAAMWLFARASTKTT